MAYKFPSDEWAKALVVELNRSESYRKSAATWEGDFYFIVEGVPGQSQPQYVYIDLWHGEARSGCLVADPNEKKPEFLIRAPIGTWRRVVEKKLDPIQGMITGQLKLKGTLSKIMRYPKAASELVACATRVPTEFPS